ncbi:MAG TPA: hypothetical protein VF258_00250, partial [Luteolibacter sp.]
EENHRHTLRKIADYQKTGHDETFGDIAPAFADYEPDEDELLPIPDSDSIGAKVQIHLSDMDLPRWKAELEGDLAIIGGLLDEMRKVTPSDDAKLQHLKTTILSKLASPINPGNRKILIFTAFADTADYLYEHLAADLLENQGIHGGIHVNHTEPKRLLDLARAACKDKDAPVPEAYQPFNKATKDGRHMEAWSGLLNTGIRSMIELKEEKDLDSLFTGGRTSALTNTIQGIEDFELIAFIVVQEVKS